MYFDMLNFIVCSQAAHCYPTASRLDEEDFEAKFLLFKGRCYKFFKLIFFFKKKE
jgi:hypothetical protein